MPKKNISNTINKKEIEKFSKIASEWWDPEGKFKPLHKFNPTRIKYIKDNSIEHFRVKSKVMPLKNLKILDIGCGRGKILGSLSSKLRLKEKPLGIDIVNHKDKDKRINFKRANVSKLSLKMHIFFCFAYLDK